MVSTVRMAWPIVRKLGEALKSVADHVGGWKTVFQVVIGGMLAAKFVALALGVQKTVLAVKGLGVAIGLLPGVAVPAAAATVAAEATIGAGAVAASG